MEHSTQHKIGKTRPPRVQITYDVMVGNATEHKELPFVVGIMSDLSGMREVEPVALKDRSFVGIYADNFNDIMAHIKPDLKLSLDNKLLGNKGKLNVHLRFESMEDFNPLNLISQIPTLTALYNSRVNLKDLLSKMDGNDELEELLMDIMADPKKQEKLLAEIENDGLKTASPKRKEEVVLSEEEKIARQTIKELGPVPIEAVVPEVAYESPYEAKEPTDAKDNTMAVGPKKGFSQLGASSSASLKEASQNQNSQDQKNNKDDFF